MLFLGAFIMRYRIELILGFPFIALTMAVYLKLAFKRESAVQNPEKLYREPLLMGAFVATLLVMGTLLFVTSARASKTSSTPPSPASPPHHPHHRRQHPQHPAAGA